MLPLLLMLLLLLHQPSVWEKKEVNDRLINTEYETNVDGFQILGRLYFFFFLLSIWINCIANIERRRRRKRDTHSYLATAAAGSAGFSRPSAIGHQDAEEGTISHLSFLSLTDSRRNIFRASRSILHHQKMTLTCVGVASGPIISQTLVKETIFGRLK